MLQPEMWTPLAWVEDVEPAGIQDVVPSPTGTTRLDRRGQRWLFIKGRLKDGETGGARRGEPAGAHGAAGRRRIRRRTSSGRSPRVANVRIHPAGRPDAAPGRGRPDDRDRPRAARRVRERRQHAAGARVRAGSARSASGWRSAPAARRLVRQLLTESLVLAALGAFAGITLAGVRRPGRSRRCRCRSPCRCRSISTSTRASSSSPTLVATVAGLLAGLAPALRATRVNLVADLKGDATLAKAGRRWTIRDGLVVLQTAVTLVLLVAAGLLTRSILQAQRVDLGFRAEGAVALGTELGPDRLRRGARVAALFERAAERVAAIPGVVVGGARGPPAARDQLQPQHRSSSPSSGARTIAARPISATWVDERYFATLGVPLLRGRNFTTAETAAVGEGRDRERGVRAPLLARAGRPRPALPHAHRRRAGIRSRRRRRATTRSRRSARSRRPTFTMRSASGSSPAKC